MWEYRGLGRVMEEVRGREGWGFVAWDCGMFLRLGGREEVRGGQGGRWWCGCWILDAWAVFRDGG